MQSSYGRNRSGGVIWRRDDAAHAMGKLTNDNDYWYDGLYQVQQHERGQLNAYLTGITSPVQSENFTFDEMGNWLAYDTQTHDLNQDRSYNKANEITSITNLSSVVQPNYDPAGNMTAIPKLGDRRADKRSDRNIFNDVGPKTEEKMKHLQVNFTVII